MFKSMIIYRIAKSWHSDLQIARGCPAKDSFCRMRRHTGALRRLGAAARRAARPTGRIRGRAVGHALHDRGQGAAGQRAQSQGQR